MLSVIWVAFLALALLCGAVTGRLDAVTAAVGTGASEAVTLAISIAGLMCFWSGVMEVIRASGLAEKLSHALTPLLRPLFGKAANDREAMELVSANVTAATPRAKRQLKESPSRSLTTEVSSKPISRKTDDSRIIISEFHVVLLDMRCVGVSDLGPR